MIDAPPVVINSPGGYLWVADVLAQKYAREGTKLIVQYCASSCRLILAVVPQENICFRASAWIGYHRDDHWTGAEPTSAMSWERGSDWIKRGYRECGKYEGRVHEAR